MNKKEWGNVNVGDVVICYDEDWDMPFGWHDEMSDMIDIQLRIHEVINKENNKLGVVLRNPNTGNLFNFHYDCVHLVQKNLTVLKNAEKFVFGSYVYQQMLKFDSKSIHNMALGEDITILESEVATTGIKLNKAVFRVIKKKCPRIIGVLLSHNILKKTRVGE